MRNKILYILLGIISISTEANIYNALITKEYNKYNHEPSLSYDENGFAQNGLHENGTYFNNEGLDIDGFDVDGYGVKNCYFSGGLSDYAGKRTGYPFSTFVINGVKIRSYGEWYTEPFIYNNMLISPGDATGYHNGGSPIETMYEVCQQTIKI